MRGSYITIDELQIIALVKSYCLINLPSLRVAINGLVINTEFREEMGDVFKLFLFFVVVIAFYAITIWQYLYPTKAIRLWFNRAYIEDPKIDETYVRRSLIIRGILFSLVFIVIIFMILAK